MAKDAAITAEEARQLLDYDPDTGIFTWLRRHPSTFKNPKSATGWNTKYAGKPAGTPGLKSGYWRITINNRPVQSHRLAMTLALGAEPDGEIDHINGDRGDNRIANLRVVTRSENRRNIAIPKRNTSGVMGASLLRGKWRAYICRGEKTIHLGSYETKAEAVAARKGAEIALGFHPNHGTRKASYEST